MRHRYSPNQGVVNDGSVRDLPKQQTLPVTVTGDDMSKSQRLRLGEVQSLYRLLGECRELGMDAVAWRRHMLAGLCRLTHAQVGLGGESRLVGRPRALAPISLID